MIDFMIIGLPRSGTTWAANWLCSDLVHCTHDPLNTSHYLDWDRDFSYRLKVSGVSCTAIWRFPDFLNSHKARKIILHREIDDVNASLRNVGFPELEPGAENALDQIKGDHFHFSELLEPTRAEKIWHRAALSQFDRVRHAELVKIHMQPNFGQMVIGKHEAGVARRVIGELQGMLERG